MWGDGGLWKETCSQVVKCYRLSWERVRALKAIFLMHHLITDVCLTVPLMGQSFATAAGHLTPFPGCSAVWVEVLSSLMGQATSPPHACSSLFYADLQHLKGLRNDLGSRAPSSCRWDNRQLSPACRLAFTKITHNPNIFLINGLKTTLCLRKSLKARSLPVLRSCC